MSSDTHFWHFLPRARQDVSNGVNHVQVGQSVSAKTTYFPDPLTSGVGRGRRGQLRAGRAGYQRLKRPGGNDWKGPQSESPPPRRNTGGAARHMQIGENPGRHHRERQLRILH